MVIQTLLSLCLIGALGAIGVVLAEVLRHKHLIKNEDARKAVHVLHALSITAWAYFLPTYTPIIIAELLFIGLVMFTKKYNTLAGMRAVGRFTYGELLFPLGVIGLCLLHPRYSWFAVCVLQLGLSDAVAAVVGKRVKSATYTVFGHTKSLAGTSAFFLSSTLIFIGYLLSQPRVDTALFPVVVLASIILATVENLSPYGSDNIAIPLAAYALLSVGLLS